MATTSATLASYANVLQYRYLPNMRSAVYTGAPLLDFIQKQGTFEDPLRKIKPGLRTKDIKTPGGGWGKAITWDIHTGQNWGIGARNPVQSATTGYLPKAGSQDYVEASLLSKSYFGMGEIDGNLIDSQGPSAAGIRALNQEMKAIPPQMRRQINMDLYLAGDGIIATIQTVGATVTNAVCDSVRNLEVGQPIVIAANNGTGAVERTITAINRTTKTITIASTDTTSGKTSIFRAGIHNTNVASEANNTLAGLGMIVSETVDYAGLDRSEAAYEKTRSYVPPAIPQANFSIDHLEDALFELAKRGAEPNLIVCDNNFYKLYGGLYWGQGRWEMQQKKIDYGYPALEYQGVPMVRDYACPEWTAFILDTSLLTLGIERDLDIMNADGNELVRMWGSEDAKRDAYAWGFCTRLNLMCSLPGALGKLTITPTGS